MSSRTIPCKSIACGRCGEIFTVPECWTIDNVPHACEPSRLPNTAENTVCSHGSLRRSCEVCERDARIAELEAECERLRGEVTTATETAKYILRDLGEHMEPFCDKLTDARLASARSDAVREFAEWLTTENAQSWLYWNIEGGRKITVRDLMTNFLASGTGLASEKGKGGE